MASDTSKNLQGRWGPALLTFISPLIFIAFVRWALFEPYVIPSGSMIPTLLVNDHIFVNKFAYGLGVPFGQRLLVFWRSPSRWDIVVFRFPQNPDIFYVKRLVGLPGDTVEIKNGVLQINGEHFDLTSAGPDNRFTAYREAGHSVRYQNLGSVNFGPVSVPEGQYFMMGDNREQSHDSRFWGFVPEDHLVGQAKYIWLSCSEMLESTSYLCNPNSIRVDRLFTILK